MMIQDLYPGCRLVAHTDRVPGGLDGRLCCFCFDGNNNLFYLTAKHVVPTNSAETGRLSYVTTQDRTTVITDGDSVSRICAAPGNFDVAAMPVPDFIRSQLRAENFCLTGELKTGGGINNAMTATASPPDAGQAAYVSVSMSGGQSGVAIKRVTVLSSNEDAFILEASALVQPGDSGTCIIRTTTAGRQVCGMVSYGDGKGITTVACTSIKQAFDDLQSATSSPFALAVWDATSSSPVIGS